MSYYRYITSVYKSNWPEMNRTLRSSSVPRRVPAVDYCQLFLKFKLSKIFWEIFLARYVRSTSVPPVSNRYAATPFRDRATSTPPPRTFSSSLTSSYGGQHYSDFDYKVINYMAKLTCMDDVKQYVSNARALRYEIRLKWKV